MSEHTYNTIAVPDDADGISVQQLLRRSGISRRLLIRLKAEENGITCGGRLMRSIDTVHAGDELLLKIPSEEGGAEPNPDLIVPRVFEDEHIIICSKPHGMPVHESCGHRGDTLSNAFAVWMPGVPFRAVNRLDRDTSGLCLIAKNRRSANIKRETIEKTYFAVCEGIITEPMTIDAPIAREIESSIKRCVRDDGKPSVTNIIPLRSGNGHTLLEIHLLTGRTHQIRVHTSYIGHPLAGDDLYGGSLRFIGRQALHCGEMSLIHPVTGERISVTAPIPRDMLAVLED